MTTKKTEEPATEPAPTRAAVPASNGTGNGAGGARAKFRAMAENAALAGQKRVEFPQHGLAADVRSMSGPGMMRLSVEGMVTQRATTGPARGRKTQRVVTGNYCAIVVQETAHDVETGALIWMPEDQSDLEAYLAGIEAGLAEIRALPPDVFAALWAAGAEVSGLTKGAQDALGEGSGETDTDGSTSVSSSALAA